MGNIIPGWMKAWSSKREQAINRLQDGPLILAEVIFEDPKTYLVYLPGTTIRLANAFKEYYPGPSKPEFVLFWTPLGSFCFGYHEINAIIEEEPNVERS